MVNTMVKFISLTIIKIKSIFINLIFRPINLFVQNIKINENLFYIIKQNSIHKYKNKYKFK